MKHLKYFENIEEPQVGDYVICEELSNLTPDICNFISSNIGIIEYTKNDDGETSYYIKYENVPEDIFFLTLRNNKRDMSREEIIHFSKNKEDLEYIINANKYNL